MICLGTLHLTFVNITCQGNESILLWTERSRISLQLKVPLTYFKSAIKVWATLSINIVSPFPIWLPRRTYSPEVLAFLPGRPQQLLHQWCMCLPSRVEGSHLQVIAKSFPSPRDGAGECAPLVFPVERFHTPLFCEAKRVHDLVVTHQSSLELSI